MNKLKVIIICGLIPFFILMGFTFIKIKEKQEFQQKLVLAQEIRKGLVHLMLDLRQARTGAIIDAPADGQWHSRVAFIQDNKGILEYIVKDGHLWRIDRGNPFMIADHITDLRMRREGVQGDILELQIEAHDGVTVKYVLKIKVHH